MGNSKAFNAVVAARTRAAKFIVETPDVLAQWVALGGLAADLEVVAQRGDEAEASDGRQRAGAVAGTQATVRLREAFAALKVEHAAILAAVSAMRATLAGQPVDARLEAIVADRASWRPATAGTARRRRSTSYEAARAEIARDAERLLALREVADALAQRRVTRERLEALLRDAQALPAAMGAQSASKAARKAVTAEEGAAVEAQRRQWAALYPLLRRLAARDPRVKALLRDATR